MKEVAYIQNILSLITILLNEADLKKKYCNQL